MYYRSVDTGSVFYRSCILEDSKAIKTRISYYQKILEFNIKFDVGDIILMIKIFANNDIAYDDFLEKSQIYNIDLLITLVVYNSWNLIESIINDPKYVQRYIQDIYQLIKFGSIKCIDLYLDYLSKSKLYDKTLFAGFMFDQILSDIKCSHFN